MDNSESPTPEVELEKALNALSAEDNAAAGMSRLSWSDYCGSRPIFRNLVDIRGFTLLLDLAPLPELSDRVLASQVATDMYGIVLTAIEQAGFFQQDMLKITSDIGSAAVSYADDRYDFAVQVTHSPDVTRQGQLAIMRTGSRFYDFHDWYVGMASHFPDLVRGVMQVLRDVTHRRIEAFRGALQFRFLLHELRAGDVHAKVRNTDLMSKLIRGVPDDAGDLSESPAVIESAGRIDVNLSRWVKTESQYALERYFVEAPANKDGAGLWLQFSYNGETYSLGTQRQRFDLDAYLRQFGRAYVDFLRDKALDRFLAGLLGDTVFRTATDSLP